MIAKIVNRIGKGTLDFCTEAGSLVVFVCNVFITLFTTRPKIKKIFNQANHIGVNSLNVVLLTGSAIGAILAFEAHVGLHKFGGERFIGVLIFLSMGTRIRPGRQLDHGNRSVDFIDDR